MLVQFGDGSCYATAVLTKRFQADLEVVLLVSHCDAIAKEHLHIWGPERVVYRHIRIMRRAEDLVHQLLRKTDKSKVKLKNKSCQNLSHHLHFKLIS